MSTFINSACCGYGAVSVPNSSGGGGSSIAGTPPQEEFIVGEVGSPIATNTKTFTWLPILGKNVKILLDGILVADKTKLPTITDRQWVIANIVSGEIEFKDNLFAGQRVTIMY